MTRAGLLLAAFLPAANVVCAAGSYSTNLLSNSGFERRDDKGQPVAWRLPAPQFKITNESPFSGQACLRFDNTNAERYLLSSQPVDLQPGRRYELEARVRTRGVRGGQGGGATVCVEWSDAQGTFIGGSYPQGISGTKLEWQKVVTLVGPLPSNAARSHVSCYLRRGATGTAWWDDVSLREYRPPAVAQIATDRYRDQSTGGIVTAFAELALAENGLSPDGVRIDAIVRDADGRAVATGAVRSVSADAASFVIDAGALAPGRHEIVCTVRTAAGGPVGYGVGRLERLAAFPARKAFIDEHRRLVLDGRPFFPLGAYWGAVTAEHLAIYSNSPFNCIMPYADIRRSGVDLAWSNGVRVIYSVKDFYPGRHGLRTTEEARAKIAERVAELKDHPAVIAWYINDELPLTMLDELAAHRRWIEELDPGRPAWSVLYQVGQMRSYLPTFDIAGADPYPIPNKPLSLALDWTRRTREATFGSRAVWMVPQIFNWASYRESDAEKDKGRAPTLDEMRCMAWSCVAAGANGLIFYSWFDLWRMDKTAGEGGRARVREPFEERWKDVCTMAAEIRDRIPMLLSADPVPAVRVEASAQTAWGWRAHEGHLWLITVNNDRDAESELKIRFPATMASCRSNLGRAGIAGAGADWTVKLEPMSVAVLRFAAAGPDRGRPFPVSHNSPASDEPPRMISGP